MDDNKLHDFIGPSKEKCNYYNRTRNRLLITAYEGIPENLLLNALGCLVSIIKITSNVLLRFTKICSVYFSF